MNLGPSAATNNNAVNARGKYLAFLASDDVFLPNKLESQLRFLDNNPAVGIVFGLPIFIDDDGQTLPPEKVAYGSLFNQHNRSRAEWLRFFFFKSNCLCGPSALVRRTLADKVGLHDPRLLQFQDFDYWIRACLLSDIHVLDEPLLKYRIHLVEKNLSLDPEAAGNRNYWEMSRILWNFTKITNRNFFFEIFPETNESRNDPEMPLTFLLAKLALSVKQPSWQSFGIELLHECFGAPSVRKRLQKRGFGSREFFRLTAEVDCFNLRALSDRGREIASFNQTVVERDGQIASLNQVMAERDAQIASLNQRVAERETQVATLNQAVAERDAQIASLNQVAISRDEILASTSWRLTKPLRMVGPKLKNAMNVWRLLPRILTIGGGLGSTSIKTLRVLRREGLSGVKHRIVYAATGKTPTLRAPASSDDNASSHSYDEWIRRYDTLTDAVRAEIKRTIEKLPRTPVISVVMPTYNPELEWLEEAIESVRTQMYPYWELCIADDASTDPRIRPLLKRHARQDQRVKVVFRQKNEQISATSNSAVELAAGEYIAFLDHDDLLRDHALFWVAKEINDHPDVDLIYSDEDKIDVDGKRFDPYFKPDWNPALLLSQNFFRRLGVYRRSLVTRVGGFRVGFEGSQDHDLVLRCADATNADRIRHIPRILYHSRSMPRSTARAQFIDAKPHAWHSGVRAIEDHLRRRKIEGHVVSTLSQYYQVDYPLTGLPPKVSIVIPSTCKPDLLRPCMEALLERTTYPDFEVLLAVNKIDFQDAERSAYLGTIARAPRVRVLVYEDRPFSYSWTNNWAIRQATGSVLCLMNDDVIIITTDWLEKLVARLQLDRVGGVGPMLYYPDNRIQHAGVTLGIHGVAGHTYIGLPRGSPGYFGRAALEQDLSGVTGACMVLRREAFEQVNGFNEELAVAFNDVDLCIRLRNAGWRIIWTPQVEQYHYESASFGHHNSPERREQFEHEVQLMRKLWGPLLDNDPFHNPNLSLYDYNISLAFPPRVPKLPTSLMKS